MFTERSEFLLALILAWAPATSAFAQAPKMSSGQPVLRSAASGLENGFHALVAAQPAPAWIGYAVPMVPGDHGKCCGGSDACCGRCYLESEGRSASTARSSDRISLETAGYLHVLFRIDQRRVQKIRSFSGDCELDTGGLPLYWFTDVRPGESTALLASFVADKDNEDQSRSRLCEGALAAIAMHKDDSADRVFEGFAAPGRSEYLREKASFWLGATRGRRGYEILLNMLRNDPSAHVRGQVIFALSLSSDPGAVGTMIEAAKKDRSDHVRGQALFWLAQKAGKKAIDAIAEAVENDPETEVKKKAVFALSQLPADDGVPRLIQVARTNSNPAVRKQAIFWLGQSKDGRALTFFEEILGH